MTIIKKLLFTAILMAAMAVCAAAQAASGTVQIGAIKSISGSTIVLTADSGPEIKVEVQEGARLLRIAPGQTSLKDAAPITLQELQVKDRIRVRGTASADGKSIAAVSVIAMKQEDLAARHQKELQDWQRRSIGGPVKAVSTDGTVTISVTSGGATKDVEVKTTKATVVRRYPPDSAKFEDAKPSTLSEAKPGDQLRARGTKSPDGTEFAADEVVTGTFPYVKGLIISVDATKNTVTVNDVVTKKPVAVKITSESQVRKLPAMAAQFLAMRIKAQVAGGNTTAPGTPAAAPQAGPSGSPHAPDANGNGSRSGGDFNQMLGRIPPSTIAVFQKGEAVLALTTQDGTAITLLGGVEALLTAPNGNMDFLSPWNLGGAPEGAQ